MKINTVYLQNNYCFVKVFITYKGAIYDNFKKVFILIYIGIE